MPLSQIVSASIEDGAVAPVDLSSVAQYTGFKNRIINGAFGIWQRGTTTSTNTFLADRWANYAATSITASRSTDVPAGFQYSVSISGTNVPQTYQRIESVNCIDLPGQSITVSFWAKQTSGAGASSLAVSLASPNAADNYASTTPIGTTTFTGSTSWTQYTATYTNVNSAIANGIQIIIYANTSGAATFLVTGVQIEKGVTATSFDYRPYGTELSLCQRYYEVLYADIGTNGVVSSYFNGSTHYTFWQFQQNKRASPTVALGSGSVWTNGTPVIYGGISKVSIGGITTYFYNTNTAGTAALTASAEL